MILPLQLRHSPNAVATADADAWFVPGASVDHWLEVICAAGLADADTALFVVPRSLEDRTPAGLLVVPENVAPATSPAGLPCRQIAGRIFVPVDAGLQPPGTDAEVRELCALPVAFYHPTLGFSGFDEESALRVADLIEAPSEVAAHWNAARSGPPPLPELETLLLAQPPSLDDVLGDAKDDIGSEPPKDLPPAPNEPKENPIAKSGRALRRIFVQGVQGAIGKLPQTGAGGSWADAVKKWANQQLHSISKELDTIRNKELHRLLHLLKTDPEAGLRHALPLNQQPHRGLAPPGGQLGYQNPNFNLSQLGGGGPADFWNVPADLQALLRQRYREMADRELRLGRHRRAAYIYAHLLGDLISAANALKQGQHFREAALIYDEHLKDPLGAAQCLAEGGFLLEAIERYEKLGRWLDVADLHERLGNRDAAHSAIRRVIDDLLAQDDRLGAAKLLDERLRATEEALDVLARAWPSSRQAASCVGAWFQMMARLGRHEGALERLAQFRRETISTRQVSPLLGALREPARDFPNETVRHRAADLMRVLIARQLERTSPTADEAGHLMEFLVRLAPEDRLLPRDVNRQLLTYRERVVARPSPPKAPPPLPGKRPEILRRFQLPGKVQWLQLRSDWHYFYALGITGNRLNLVRGVWEGIVQGLAWDCQPATVKHGLIFAPSGEHGDAVLLASTTGSRFAEKRFPANDQFFGQSCVAGSPGWLTPQHWPLAVGTTTIWTAHVAAGRAVLSCHDKRGRLQRTVDVTAELLEGAERETATRLSLVAMDNEAAIALGNRLVLTASERPPERIELPGQVIGLVPTLPHVRKGVAALLEHGVAMHWVGRANLLELERDLASPLATFVPGGPTVLISGHQMVLLDLDSRGVQHVTRVSLSGEKPVGVSATASPGQFAVLGAQGEMTVFRISR